MAKHITVRLALERYALISVPARFEDTLGAYIAERLDKDDILWDDETVEYELYDDVPEA